MINDNVTWKDDQESKLELVDKFEDGTTIINIDDEGSKSPQP